jgi:outer membrane protein assembly factor BamA
MSFVLSDLLGDHTLALGFQATTSFDDDFSVNDLGGAVMYQNLKHRLDWGVILDQTPYRTGFIGESVAVVEDRPALVESSLLYRQSDRGATGMVSYPFSRAQRVEGSASYRRLQFDQILRTTAFDLETGDILLEDRQELPTLDPLNLAQATAALVYDTSSFGATSPVLGQRYRLEVSPTFGSLRYTGVLVDYRRYMMPARLYTIAGRFMHYGRYGGDAEDPRLFPLFLGYPSLVRGYDVGTFDADECPPTPDGSCEAFDRLVGSRMLVGNLELRFPLLRPFGLRESVYGPVPVEMALFADAGLAWSRAEKPSFAGGERRGVSSVGAAFRVNALGFAVLQFDVSRPLQRAGRGWVFQFSMSPGF